MDLSISPGLEAISTRTRGSAGNSAGASGGFGRHFVKREEVSGEHWGRTGGAPGAHRGSTGGVSGGAQGSERKRSEVVRIMSTIRNDLWFLCLLDTQTD